MLNRTFVIAFAAVLAYAGPAVADAPSRPDYVLVADPKLGMEGGVLTFGSIGRLIYHYEDALPRLVDVDEAATVSGKFVGILGRSLKLVFLDDPLADVESTAIHEVFGHGARAREFGQQPNYTFTLPGVYCLILSPKDKECTSLAKVQRSPELRDQDLAITLGGIESNYLTAWWINVQIMQTGGWAHHGDLLVYLRSKGSYVTSFFDGDLKVAGLLQPPSNDVDHYVTGLQDRFNRWRPEDRASIASKLQSAYLWNLFDPTLLFAFYSTVVNSIYRGERYSRLPLPSVGDTSFYPVPRFNVSPFGAEHYLDVFLSRRGAALDLYARIGSSGLASYSGAGVRVMGWRPFKRLGLGGELDVWNQPETLPYERAVYNRQNRYGGNVGALVDVSVIDRIGASVKIAYKSEGYLMGQPLGDGLYGYAGITITP